MSDPTIRVSELEALLEEDEHTPVLLQDRLRALIARAREGEKLLYEKPAPQWHCSCGDFGTDECVKHQHEAQGHTMAPTASAGTECTCFNAYTSEHCPIHAGTEGPGKLRRYYVNTIWLHDEDIGEVAGETVAIYLASDLDAALARVEGEKK